MECFNIYYIYKKNLYSATKFDLFQGCKAGSIFKTSQCNTLYQQAIEEKSDDHIN